MREDLSKAAAEIQGTRRFTDPKNWVRTRLLVRQRMIRRAESQLGMHVTADGVALAMSELPRPRRPYNFYHTLQQAAAFERELKHRLIVPSDPFLWMHCRVALYTGARRSEIFCIRVRDVQLEGTEKYPDGAMLIWNSELEQHKQRTGTPDFRECPLFPKLRKAVEQFIGKMGLGPDDFVCLSRKRAQELRNAKVDFDDAKALYAHISQLHQNSLYRYLDLLCTAAGIPSLGCHIWRQTFCGTRARMVHPTGNPMTFSDLQGEIGHIKNSKTLLDVHEKATQVALPGTFAILDWRQIDRAGRKQQREGREKRSAISKRSPFRRPLIAAPARRGRDVSPV